MAIDQSSRYVSVSQDFTQTPGARYRNDGAGSAEEFLELITPAFEGAVKAGEVLTIDLDGVVGYASSFLQGTFGNLAAQFGSELVRNHISVISNDDPFLLQYVARYVEEAARVVEEEAA